MDNAICIWGSGLIGHEVARILKMASLKYEAVFDSDNTLKGKAFDEEHNILGVGEWTSFDKDSTSVVLSFGRPHYLKCKNEVMDKIHNAHVISFQELYNIIAERIYDVRNTKWDIDYSKQIRRWLENFSEEIPYHFDEMEWLDGVTRTPELEIKRLRKYDLRNDQILLDVGCGGTLVYSNKINGADLNYVPVDVLADAYKIGHEKYSYKPNTDIHFGMCEHLTKWFAEKSADYIVYDNSLDHSLDPVRGLIESYRVLKTGGVLSLKHHAVESMFGTAEGLHEWDFFMTKAGEYVVACGGTDNLVNVSQLFKGAADIEVWEEKNEEIAIEIIEQP